MTAVDTSAADGGGLTDELRAYLNTLVIATVERAIDHAPTPSTRSATVDSIGAQGTGIVNVVIDGEDDPVPATNASGASFGSGQRVQVIFFPPHAAVIVGSVGDGAGWATGDLCASFAATKSGFLIADFSAVSRNTYAALFGVIGTAAGPGDGTTTFNLPDYRGRGFMGSGTGTAPGATAHALGTTAGEEKHTLTIAEMPSHNHTFSLASVYNNSGGFAGASGGAFSFSVNNPTIGNTGSGGSHNTLMPVTTCNIFIKT